MLLSLKSLRWCKIFIGTILILELCSLQERLYVSGDRTEGLKYRPRMRAAKIAHSLRAPTKAAPLSRTSQVASKDNFSNGKYEIRSVFGEPDYKSVNLTWEVEFVPASGSSNNIAERTNSSNSAEELPPKAFQIFYCELQSFGPHRCRSKLVNESAANAGDEVNTRQVRQFSTQIDNLRMATKYSFHIRPQAKVGRLKISARSGVFDNEIYDGNTANKNDLSPDEQTIVIPTKGFTAQATQCLPHASEIEVETGPYFAGKIVVDGSNCGVKGNPDDPKDKYTMRIDHKMCGSMVKPETNTVETFITVQENLGIFTHSTRRFVVVCSFQSGMQTVRASFTVPGRDGMAAPLDNDPFQPDDQTRLGREQRFMRFVDKSALVLKESDDLVSQREEATVEEVAGPTISADVSNSVATVEDIVPGINEEDIKHENNAHSRRDLSTIAQARLPQWAKLAIDPNDVPTQSGEKIAATKGDATTLHHIAGNIGGVVLTVSLTVIIIGVFIFIAYREVQQRRGVIRQNLKLQPPQQTSPQQQHTPKREQQRTHLPRSTHQHRSLELQQTGTL